MCQIFSCIVTRGGKVYPQKDDPSHTAIAAENQLPEDGKSELLRAKVEVVPRDEYSYADEPTPTTWQIIVDEPTCPNWYNDRHDRNAMVAAATWWKSRVIPSDAVAKVSTGFWVVLSGSPQIKQNGGILRTYNRSSPQITQSGGMLRTYNDSTPQIRQSNGEIRTHNDSAPQIRQSGGNILTCDTSAPQIAQSGGAVITCDSSTPQITQSGGVLRTYNHSAPQIRQSGGTIWTNSSRDPQIARVK